jgi:Ankyrin repeats (many copies)
MLHRPAESGNAAVLETMLACGFDPETKDKDSVTPLHRAALGGHADAVRVLLQYGANVNAADGMFSAAPLVWAVEGRRNSKHGGVDHVEVARLLIAAGSSLGWTPPEGAPSTRGDFGRVGGATEGSRASSGVTSSKGLHGSFASCEELTIRAGTPVRVRVLRHTGTMSLNSDPDRRRFFEESAAACWHKE